MVKKPPANARDIRDMALNPGLGRSPGGRHGDPLVFFVKFRGQREEPGWLQSIGWQSWTQLKRFSTHACLRICSLKQMASL